MGNLRCNQVAAKVHSLQAIRSSTQAVTGDDRLHVTELLPAVVKVRDTSFKQVESCGKLSSSHRVLSWGEKRLDKPAATGQIFPQGNAHT